MAIKKAENPQGVTISSLDQEGVTLRLLGRTPLFFNAMSAKAKRTLLLGGARKTAAEKKDIKHSVRDEYRASTYRLPDGETLLGFPAPGIKAAMATAALETGGLTKTSVHRLIFLPEQSVRIWGTPRIAMSVVRSSDANRTPDIRTRAVLPEWCAEVRIEFIRPTLNVVGVTTLLSNAGVICGIGDFRQEKGRGSFGTFTVEGTDMSDRGREFWDRLTTEQGREAQEYALANPVPFDIESETMLAEFDNEIVARGLGSEFDVIEGGAPKTSKRKTKAA